MTQKTENEKIVVDLLYSYAVGVFLQSVLHISELWLQALDVLL